MRMALWKPFVAACLVLLLESCVDSAESSPNNNGDTSSIPMIASGKRQHNIMRFGKRPAGGPNLIHVGKRDDAKPLQHSFLYFGKRYDGEENLPELIQYLQKNRDNSYKRGHTIMRFGKRTPSHNMIRFGRSDDYNDYDDLYPNDYDIDEDKRGGHSMMYFGKRGGHSMMYFGKRVPGHSILSFGKRDDDKRAHSMIHFGKREDEDSEDLEKRAHSMIHFGKREEDDEPYLDEMKRGSHSMIHFGKRDYDEESLPYFLNPANSEKRQHNLLRFGKKTEGVRKGSHAMIHFGKRDDDKRAHSMIHFGKRSVDQAAESNSANQSESDGSASTKAVARMKRDVEEAVGNSSPLLTLVGYDNTEEGEIPDEDMENAIKTSEGNIYQPGRIPYYFSYPDISEEQGLLPIYPDYQTIKKDAASKNVFLRFG